MDKKTFTEIINAWPSARVLGEDIGEDRETVAKWRQRDRIPSRVWRPLLEASRRRRYGINATMLINIANDRQ